MSKTVTVKLNSVSMEEYKKLELKYNDLLAKYNGVFEWAVNLYDRYFKGYSAEDLKEYYEESLK